MRSKCKWVSLMLLFHCFSVQAYQQQELNESLNEEISREVHGAQAYSEYGLTQEDIKLYESLMNTTSAKYRYQHLEPIEVLGIEAKTDEERKRYAKIIAQATKEKVERLIALQREVDLAYLELYGQEPAFSLVGDEVRYSGTASLQKTQRYILIAGLKDKETGVALKKLMRRLKQSPGLKLDIYIKSSSQMEIQKWAAQNVIPIELVKKKDVTLNMLAGEMIALTGSDNTKTPVVGTIDGKTTRMISLNNL